MTHFADEGQIDTDNKRQWKLKRDAYRLRDKSLVSKGKEIKNITYCEVFIDVVSTWKMGKGGFTSLLVTKTLLKEQTILCRLFKI